MVEATPTLLLATRNGGKVRELRAMLAPLGVQVLGLGDLPPVPPVVEDGDTFVDNACKKARQTAEATGMAVLADDSGLCVDALDGRPGVYSARFAGPEATDADNNAKLLAALDGTPEPQRTARFVAVLALQVPPAVASLPWWARLDGLPCMTFRGEVEGRIVAAPRGEGGFGYDPLFVADGQTLTMAELTPGAKHAISHRGRAVALLLAHIRSAPPVA